MTADPLSVTGRRTRAAASHREAEPLPPLVRASVCAGGTTTSYLRAGSGDVVVLLGASFVTPGVDPLVSVLAKSHRVVVPDLVRAEPIGGKPAVAFASRLRSFLDGLGSTEVSIVAADDVALAALAFTLTDAGRVRRLVLTFRDAPDPLDTGEPLTERLEQAQCELLVLRELTGTPMQNDREERQAAIVGVLG